MVENQIEFGEMRSDIKDIREDIRDLRINIRELTEELKETRTRGDNINKDLIARVSKLEEQLRLAKWMMGGLFTVVGIIGMYLISRFLG